MPPPADNNSGQGGFQRFLVNPTKDIRNLADVLRVLPEIARLLESVRQQATELNSEVKLMRQSVNRIEAEVEELKTVLSPWQRTRARFSRKNGED